MNGPNVLHYCIHSYFPSLYYGSYKYQEILWMLGVVILLLMMATAFMGYTS